MYTAFSFKGSLLAIRLENKTQSTDYLLRHWLHGCLVSYSLVWPGIHCVAAAAWSFWLSCAYRPSIGYTGLLRPACLIPFQTKVKIHILKVLLLYLETKTVFINAFLKFILFFFITCPDFYFRKNRREFRESSITHVALCLCNVCT